MNFRSFALAACLSLGCAPSASAQTAPTLAQDGLHARIDHLSASPSENGFKLGMLQTLRAVEKSLQARYDYGLGDQIPMLPLLRLGTAPNPAPRPSGPDTLSGIMATFLADMDTARASLRIAEEQAGVHAFDLDLNDLWFDVNRNARRDTGEAAVDILGAVVLGRFAYSEFQRSAAQADLTIRFDTADHAWLTAYTHMLSGVANLFLAFDPEPVLRDLETQRALMESAPDIPNYFDQAALAEQIARLEQELAPVSARLDENRLAQRTLQQERSNLVAQRHETTDEATRAQLDAQIDALDADLREMRNAMFDLMQEQGLIRSEIAAARAKTGPGADSEIQQFANEERATIDMIYVILAAIQQAPDPAHIRATSDHWRAMITENRRFWALLAEETDNDREWIPNPQQASVLPVEIPARVAEAWQTILTDAEAVLDGRLLIPHPLLPPGYGISLPAYVENPVALDLTRWIHGVGAYPYAAKGPRITGQSWQAFERLTSGNAAGFALFFN